MRRAFLAGSLASAAATSAAGKASGWADLGGEAYAYLLPLLEMRATRARMLAAGASLNRFRHVRVLSNARSRTVTTPNSDTLYSSAWAELTNPATLTLPPTRGRYLSVALMDAFSNNFAVLRGEPDRSVEVTVAGPRELPGDGRLIAPTTRVWALARIAANPHDLADAHAVQDGVVLTAADMPAGQPEVLPPRSDVAAVFRAAGRWLAETELPARDASILTRMARAGIGPGLAYPARDLNDAEIEQLEAGAAAALASLNFADGPEQGGWIYPRPSLGDFGTDYRYRASIALTGLAALPLHEAIYLKGVGDIAPGLYDGRRAYRLRMAADQLPRVDAFWSLALYEATPQGQLFFYDNPLGRYSIGSHDRSLVIDDQGGVEILISHAGPPQGSVNLNWLPAPEGPFALQLRAFRPRAKLWGSVAPSIEVV